MTAKNHFENDREFVDPNSDFTKSTKQRWEIVI